jgi:hypothetical protein
MTCAALLVVIGRRGIAASTEHGRGSGQVVPFLLGGSRGMNPPAPFCVGCDMDPAVVDCWEVLEWQPDRGCYRLRESFRTWMEADRRVKELWP